MSHEGQPLNVGAVEFNPNTFVKGTSSTPYASHGFEIPKENSYGTPESHALKTTERTFRDVMALQQRQNETIIATHQQLAAAVTLPQLAVSKFKGDPTEYRTFMMSFDARIQCRATTSADRLYYLNQHLEGEPRDLIEGCLHMDSEKGYTEARQLLQREYGDPYKISMAYVNKILRWAPIKSDDSQGLKRLSIFLTKCKIAMKNVSYMCVLDHAPNMQAVVSKLPPNLQNKWRDQAAKRKRTNRAPASFTDLAEFVESASDSANDPVFGKEALQSRESAKTERNKGNINTRNSFQPKHKGNSFATNLGTPANPRVLHGAGSSCQAGNRPLCQFCGHSHDLDDCEQFKKQTADQRRAFLRDKQMCFGCYGENHVAKSCLNKRKCKLCAGRHPTALHIDGFRLAKHETRNNSTQPENATGMSNARANIQSTSCHVIKPDETIILHAILPVKVKKRGSNKAITTYAFYDNGSAGCFLTESLKEQIGAEGERTKLQLSTMHGQSLVATSVVDDLIVTDMEGNNAVEMPRSYTQMEIPVNKEQIPTPKMVKQWVHLREVAEKMPKFVPSTEIGMLIGSNCPAALEPLEVVPSEGQGPYAMRLHHGWTISGPLQVQKSSNPANISCHRISVREVESVKEVVSPQVIQQMFELDFNDHKISPDDRAYSQEDKRFIDMAKENTTYCTYCNGHYVIPLPFRGSNVIMPNNKDQAVKRANWQRKKMMRDENYRNDYVNFVNYVIAKGYAQKVSDDHLETESGKVWYIPHHGIYHPRKPGKIRVVFDCSARYQGTSLNEQLMQGPDLTDSLIGVLTRFRQDPIAFMADIEAMFHQVQVPTEQCDFVRFLWWPNGNLNAPLQEYQRLVHLFGAVSSPSCSNFALRQTADDTEMEHGPLVAETIRRNFYVDDCLKSAKDDKTAVELVQGVRQTCHKGGFNLTKFISNSRAVLDSVPPDQRSKGAKDLDLDHDRLPIERALGVEWCVESDVFGFRIVVDEKPPTRRGILSTVSSVYDPLGFVAPFILPAKKILQDLCRESIGWDDDVSEEYKSRWTKWLNELPLLDQLKVRRCVKPPEFGPVVSEQIHVFSDASSIGYGAAAYLRLRDESGRIHCSLLMGKARLAPVKAVTIPRLELTAATVSVRVAELLKKEINGDPEFKYHTDSTTVLRYIANEQQRFHVFVANRVQLIRDHSDLSQWRYVDTKNNPADNASRGLDGPSILRQQRWLEGPDFLWKPEDEWPQQAFSIGQVPEDDPEIKKTTTSNATNVQLVSPTRKLIEYFSDWRQLKKAVAVFLRVKETLRRRRNNRLKVESQCLDSDTDPAKRGTDVTAKASDLGASDRTYSPLTVQDLVEAECAILKFVQSSAFGHEIRVLEGLAREKEQDKRKHQKRKKASMKSSSSVYRLDPFMDGGVLRVGGRLNRADLPHEVKHPVILPRKSHVTPLLIRHTHKSLGHA